MPRHNGRGLSVIVVFFVWRIIVIWLVIITRLHRIADRTPVLVAGEGKAFSAGITGCCGGGHTNNLILAAPCPVMTDR